ncbi:MAG: CRISPR-associated protein Cas4 [Lachnospiraceae bacterium]|nr:CRISPR-associated protein Cas4 [Lachnospiraceae bacterium]
MDNDRILLSWITQYVYCPHRLYLEAVEQYSADNIYTAEGTVQHQRVHEPKIEKRGDDIRITGLSVYSDALNLFGICDEVKCTVSRYGCYVPLLDEKCKITPTEFKHGKSGYEHKEYNLQLTAQAMCLEEMFNCKIEKGEIYYIGSKIRTEVQFTDAAKKKVKNILIQINQIIDGHAIPQAEYKKRCPKCSMYSICNPKTDMILRYIENLWEQYHEKN